MFTFSILGVRKVIERGKADAAANGGFRNPCYGLKPGKGENPGLWLVGDQGVYIMSNGKLGHGDRPLVVYSDECHPVGNPDWFHYKHRHFGGDDGIEFIDAELIWCQVVVGRKVTLQRLKLVAISRQIRKSGVTDLRTATAGTGFSSGCSAVAPAASPGTGGVGLGNETGKLGCRTGFSLT
ncbi:DUF3085 domain-containing protein (plasmid) [Mesorhizobium sp. NBSH29]|nr:DUF3085 domain-containing protein [Mesorhizobium sp. NBSH29]QPC89059.1 DUF3085 domain-containing protein [Mesorhizobium sp. NBSH29]